MNPYVASAHTTKLPTTGFSAILSVRPGENLFDGFLKAWKYIAEHQPVDTHNITFDYSWGSLLSGLTLAKTESPHSSHPFKIGIRITDQGISAFIKPGKVNGLYIVTNLIKEDLKTALGLTSFIDCDSTYNEEASAFEAVGSLDNQDGGVFLKLTYVETQTQPLKYNIKARFEVKQIPIPSSNEKNIAYIPLAGIDKSYKLTTLVSSHLRLDVEKESDGQWMTWYSSL